ncbi:MAG: TolC family protein [Rhizobiales bacterium]|nr:TolC family protein [Hyphomicrobiales bacterium]
MSNRLFFPLALAAWALTAGGCALKPEPMTDDQTSSFAADKLGRVVADNEPVSRPIDLYEAIARALKYNLDQRVELMQQALRERELELSTYQGLPSLVLNSGYTGRDRVNASSSESVLTGAQSLVPSTSQDRNMGVADATLSWNILDFGLSYVRARQAADQVLAQAEMRRKVLNRVVEDVRTAYWRAITSERMMARLRTLEHRAQNAMANSRELFEAKQTSPVEALTYQRELVEIKREAQRIEGELALARGQLASLMNLPPGSKFRLVAQNVGAAPGLPSGSGRQLVMIALQNRPEMREIAYKVRVNERETDAALLEMLPGFNVFLGANVDSNSYLYNQHWVGWGAKASWNLLKVFQHPAKQQVVDAQAKLLDERALAITMAVMTQVHASRVRYTHARREFATSAQYLDVQRRLLGQIRASQQTDRLGEQTLIREEMNTLVAEVKRDIAFASLQNAYANVYASLGLDAYPPVSIDETSVAGLASALRKTWVARGSFKQIRVRPGLDAVAKAEGEPGAAPAAVASLARPATSDAATSDAAKPEAATPDAAKLGLAAAAPTAVWDGDLFAAASPASASRD